MIFLATQEDYTMTTKKKKSDKKVVDNSIDNRYIFIGNPNY